MAELNYKSSNIAKVERKYNANFFGALTSLDPENARLADVLLILEAGGLTEDEAGSMLDTDGLVEAIKVAVTALVDAGFLAKSPEIVKAKAELQKALQEETSPTTGENKKA